MHVKKNHLLSRIRQLRSPNRSNRTEPMDVSLIVIHGISLPEGEFGNGCVDRLFLNQLDVNDHQSFADLECVQVSSHLLIDRLGRTTQYVPFDEQAWHAGNSSWKNRSHCNEFSIGIELEGTDDRPYTSRQYSTLAKVTRALFKMYPRLSADSIVGHLEVAPERKTDPGPAFDWPRYLLSITPPP
ncbi:MAG: 1,6-anhydro-N-acetylmuramyl-L-alanine amidase AmpD [Gammaproteobacteria bacterium]|nr:1,6-anhydro-N-acetylmuramyl-L-alanine amidase AmpD [Gammaproteobacteria bacterium]MCZ6854680.1 1,6-anhydro-N-acetylmuramyl-L-alanine amidase AmpD [Gammaproteobacteria bacterium]